MRISDWSSDVCSSDLFEVGHQVLGHDMMPILEPEYSIKAADRAEGETILRDEILAHLDALPEGRQVMLKLSLPVEANLFRRPEERRVGKEFVSTCRSRWSPHH